MKFQNYLETRLLLSALNGYFNPWQQKCAKKQISFDIIWIAILNKAELKEKNKSDSMRSLKGKEKVRSRLTFSIYKINIINYFNKGLIFTPELFILCKKVWGTEGT